MHEQEPGTDQHILSGSQAPEDFRATDVSRAFDLLRTRLRQTVKQNGWINIGVASPTAGCGTTFTAANLAASLLRVPCSRTVLMDFNMRTPGLAKTLDMDASQTGGLRDFLAGDVAISDYILRTSDTLAVGLADGPQEDAAEIMQDPATAASLAEMRAALNPDIVLYDMPPLLTYDDTSAFLPQLDGILLVSDGTQTMARCLIPWFDGAILSQEWKETLWDKFVMGAPRPRTSSELQYSDRKHVALRHNKPCTMHMLDR